MTAVEYFPIVIVGGAQAGLATSCAVSAHKIEHIVLDASARIGDSWRARWNSLRLFSPARYSALPGMSFPGDPNRFPSKDEMADFLELYAQRLALPLRLNQRVTRLGRADSRFAIETQDKSYEADQVIVATGAFQRPVVPHIAAGLAEEVFQLHTTEYRNPAQLHDGDALVVGAGSSGIQIARELAGVRKVQIAVGTRLPSFPRRILGRDLFWWLDKLNLMNIPARSRFGRIVLRKPDILPGLSLRRLQNESRVEVLGRAIAARGRTVFFDDGTGVEVTNVIWATGYRNDFSWIDIPVFDSDGEPIQRRGTTAQPGLYFVGLRLMHTPGSAIIGWVGQDAKFIADHAARRTRSKFSSR